MSNEEILERLTSVRGVGPWTVEMLLQMLPSAGWMSCRQPITACARVSPWGRRRVEGFATPQGAARIRRTCTSPHRSTAAWLLWRSAGFARPFHLNRRSRRYNYVERCGKGPIPSRTNRRSEMKWFGIGFGGVKPEKHCRIFFRLTNIGPCRPSDDSWQRFAGSWFTWKPEKRASSCGCRVQPSANPPSPRFRSVAPRHHRHSHHSRAQRSHPPFGGDQRKAADSDFLQPADHGGDASFSSV